MRHQYKIKKIFFGFRVIHIAFIGFVLSACTHTTTDPGELKEVKNNVVWKIDTLGEAGSDPYSAAIINDSLFIVVGNFVRMDSLNQYGNGFYNVAIGNGRSWKYYAVGLFMPGGSYWSVETMTDVHVNSENNIIICSRASVHQWDGMQWHVLASFIKPGPYYKQIYCMSVTSDGTIFCGGRSGTLFCVNNGAWTDISVSTTKDILNMKISPSQSGKSNTVIGVMSNLFGAADSTSMLEISSNNVTQYPVKGISNAMGALWTDNNRYYIGGIDVYSSSSIQGGWEKIASPSTYVNSISGTWKNDIFIAGYDVLKHYDGHTWSLIGNHGIELITHLACNENKLLAVGKKGNKCIVAIGSRY